MFTKLFSSILDSSLWAEDYPTRLVWITLLAMCDQDGFVAAVESALARRANVTPAECHVALRKLMDPDTESRSQVWGGRRIEAVEGGWILLNYKTYRDMRDREQQRDATRERVRQHRARQAQGDLMEPVTPGNAGKREAEAEEEAEAEAGKEKTVALVLVGRTAAVLTTEVAAYLSGMDTAALRQLEREKAERIIVAMQFSLWAKRCHHANAYLDAKREKLALARCHDRRKDPLEDVASEMFWAAEGMARDDNAMGKGDLKRYDRFDLLNRDRAHIERFAENCMEYRRGDVHRLASAYFANGKAAPHA